jgi:beta-glucosidase/6-phospho-beta-glucosidase/beta-galactosidase
VNPPRSRLFRSFWLAGFESACHVNRHGTRLDLVCATGHDRETEGDYARVRDLGFATVRESVRWPLVDRGGRLDFSTVMPMLEASGRQRVQIVWTLCHYGWPDDVALLSPAFVDRFARFSEAMARLVADHDDAVPLYSPINEISFFAWAAAEVGYIHPFARGTGLQVKRQLVRAAIAGIEAVRRVDPRARFIHMDPLIHVVTPRGRPDLARAAADQRAAQFEAWDMLAGGMHPDLGGHPRYLDIVGANFYHANQWEYPDHRLRWEDAPRDRRWVPLRHLLQELYTRYDRPIVISETSHFGEGRGRWLREVVEEVLAAREQGVPLEGLCVYPVIDRPDWDDPGHWHNSGLWDLRASEDGRLERVPCEEYVEDLRRAQAMLAGARSP